MNITTIGCTTLLITDWNGVEKAKIAYNPARDRLVIRPATGVKVMLEPWDIGYHDHNGVFERDCEIILNGPRTTISPVTEMAWDLTEVVAIVGWVAFRDQQGIDRAALRYIEPDTEPGIPAGVEVVALSTLSATTGVVLTGGTTPEADDHQGINSESVRYYPF